MAQYFPISHDDGLAIVGCLDTLREESIKQTALLAAQADTTVPAALINDFSAVRTAVQDGYAPALLPIGSQFFTDLVDNHTGTPATYSAPWDVVHHGNGTLSGGSTIPVMFSQMHYCLPFDTQFSQYQAFLKAVDSIPAGTYNVTFDSGINASVDGKTFQFTLSANLPAGGLLAGFRAYTGRDIYIYQSQTDKNPTTVTATEGSSGVSLGTITKVGVTVPASGTPVSTQSVIVDGNTVRFYGLNSAQRIAYGNNRWLHSPLRQLLNANSTGWYVPATVFDVPPSYVDYPGFLSMFPDEFVAAMQPIAQVTATNYLTDGGASDSPESDTTYDKVFLPSWEQHYIGVNSTYGGTAGLEGTAWDYWKQVYGNSTPPAGGDTVKEYIQYDLASKTTARNCWMRSANRNYANIVAYVYSSGNCSNGGAYYGNRVAPACAIG